MESNDLLDPSPWPFGVQAGRELMSANPAPAFSIAWYADVAVREVVEDWVVPEEFFFLWRGWQSDDDSLRIGERAIAMKLRFEGGALVCDQVAVVRVHGRPIQTTDLRVPLKMLLRAAGQRMLFRRDSEGYLSYGAFSVPSFSESQALGDQLVGGGEKPRRGVRLTDQHLRAVAAEYRRAVARSEPPNQAIQNNLHTSYSNATRWVATARKRVDPLTGAPFLGAAVLGLAGEDDVTRDR